MPLQVQREVVRASEGPVARLTFERPRASVLPEVSRQLVRPRELPGAPFPGAGVGLLAGVRPLVRLEVRALGVDLVAAGVRALMDPLDQVLVASPPLRGLSVAAFIFHRASQTGGEGGEGVRGGDGGSGIGAGVEGDVV